MDRQTPLKILPWPKLRLRAVKTIQPIHPCLGPGPGDSQCEQTIMLKCSFCTESDTNTSHFPGVAFGQCESTTHHMMELCTYLLLLLDLVFLLVRQIFRSCHLLGVGGVHHVHRRDVHRHYRQREIQVNMVEGPQNSLDISQSRRWNQTNSISWRHFYFVLPLQLHCDNWLDIYSFLINIHISYKNGFGAMYRHYQ